MSKSNIGNFDEYSKILADNLSLLNKNVSRKDFIKSVETLKGRIYSYNAELVKLQLDISMDVTGSYKPEYDKTFGSREALDLENNKIKEVNDNFTKLLINLDTLSKNISEKENSEASLNEFRVSIGVAPEVKPGFFQRLQTFVVDLFTNGVGLFSDEQGKKLNAIVQNLNNSLTSLIAESDKAKTPLQEKIAKFSEQSLEQAKGTQQDASLSNNLPPPPSSLPPLPNSNLNEPPARDVPPIPGQFSGRTKDLPPPPQVNASQEISSSKIDQPLPPPPQSNLSSLSPEFGGASADLPPPPQGLNTFAEDVPPPTDLPPTLPPEFGGPPTDLPPSLPPEDLQISNEIGKEGKDTGQALKDVFAKQSMDNISPEDDWDLGDSQDREGSDKTTTKTNKQDEVELIEPTTNTITKGVISPPPSGKGPPPPPGPMIVKSATKDPQIKTPSKPVPEKVDLMQEIRDRTNFQLKKVGDKQNFLDQDEFKYTEIQKKEGMQAMLGGEYDASALVNNKSKEHQMNALYSAVVGGNTELVKELVNVTIEVNTGKTLEDDWGDVVPVMETKKVYAQEDLEKVYSSAKSLENKEGVSRVQKVNIERGVAEIGKAAGIESSVSQSR